EMVAYSLVNMVGRASTASILGITVRELDKLVEIYELSEKLKGIADPEASITWARGIKNLNKRLLTPSVQDAIIRKVNDHEITNSKDVRKLRQILRDPVAREAFLAPGGAIEEALQKLEPVSSKKAHGLVGDIESLVESIRRHPWTTLAALKGDQQVLSKLDETEKLLRELRKALAK